MQWLVQLRHRKTDLGVWIMSVCSTFLPKTCRLRALNLWGLAYPCSHWARGGVHRTQGSITGPQRDKLEKQPSILTLTTLLESEFESSGNMHAFGSCVQAGEKTRRKPTHTWGQHGNSTQKDCSWESNQELI